MHQALFQHVRRRQRRFIPEAGDRSEYDPADKLNAFRSGVAAGQTGETFLTINFLSTKGTAAFGHPYGLAKKLNPALLGSNDALKGWIVTDFGSAKLAEHIYAENFR